MKISEIKTDRLIELLESIYVDGGVMRITHQLTPGASSRDNISTFFKRQPYESRIRGSAPIYSLLSYVSNPTTTQLLTSIKGKGPFHPNPKQLGFLMNQLAEAASKVIHRTEADVILYPASSSSLTRDFVHLIEKQHPHLEVDEAFVKRHLSDDVELINTDHPDWKKFESENPEEVEKLKAALKRQTKGGELELKKIYKPHVKFIKNFIKLRDEDLTLEQIFDKNVLIVDDVLSTGTTMLEMFRQVRELDPKSIAGLTIFKRTNEVH